MPTLESLLDLDVVTLTMIADYLERREEPSSLIYQNLPDEKYRLELAHQQGRRAVIEEFRFAARDAQRRAKEDA